MPTEIKAQNTTTLASVKAIYDAADQANTLLDGMQAAATAAGTTLDGIYQDAADAQTAADDAQASADSASEYAARALGNLSTVQNVTETLNWITAHGTMTLTSDVALDPTHVYFVVDPAGDYVIGSTHYSVVTEPDVADIATYYELSINESLNNYVATHLAVNSEGLWIIPDSGGNKVLIATGSGSTYTTAGTYIVGKVGGVDTVLASFTANGAQIGLSSAGNVVVDNNSVDIRDNSTVYATFGANGVTVGRDERGYSHISVENNGMKMLYNVDFYPYGTHKTLDVSYGMTETGGYEGNYPYYELGARKEADPLNYSPNATYDVGDTCRYDDKEYICKHKISTPEAWNRSHWNYITGAYSFIEGMSNIASGIDSHAEGNTTKAIGDVSHAEGSFSMSVGVCSHAENNGVSYGDYSHAENYSTSSGDYSHAEGSGIANGDYSHAQNEGTIASSGSQTALGRWNVEDNADTYSVIVGNGVSGTPSNALTVDWSGNVEAAGDVTDGAGNTLSAVAVNDIISLKPSGNITRSGTGDSRVTSYTTIASNGSKLTNNGGVKIGSGVSLVKVCYGLAINTTGTNHTLNAQLYKNSTQQSAYGFDTKQAQSGRGAISFPPTLMSVSSGDVLDIGWYGQTGDTLYANGTTLTVEVVK